MEIRGPRLTLRYPRPGDAERMFELARDPEVVRHFSWGPYTDPSEPVAWIDDAERRRADGEWLEFAIAQSEDDELIGVTGLTELAPRDRRATTGTWLGKPYWGTGANRESKALLFALAFGPLGLNRLTALASPENPRSLAALERIGFVREGTLEAFHIHRGVPRDVAILRLLRAEWERGPLREVPVEITGTPPAAFLPS